MHFLSFTRKAENGGENDEYRTSYTRNRKGIMSDLYDSFVQDEVWQCKEYLQRLGEFVWSSPLKCNSEGRTQNTCHEQPQ